jgi:hypothetical protein
MIMMTQRNPWGNSQIGFTELEHAELFAVQQLKREATMRILAQYPAHKQQNASFTISAGQDTALMSLADAEAVVAGISAIVAEQRALELQIEGIMADSGMSAAEKAAAIDAVWFAGGQ